jgi:hypothetical protein
MAKPKVPDLADWAIRSADPAPSAAFPVVRVVRATDLQFHGGWAVLTDTTGKALFAAPPSARLTIRRLEPGEPAELPAPLQLPPAFPPPVPDLEAPPVAPDPGPPLTEMPPPAAPPAARRSGARKPR